MTTINPTTPAGNDPGVVTAASRTMLGQEDFLTLLAAQLQNQDPLSPLENSEFMGQMSQFSMVGGIDRVNDTLMSMQNGIGGMGLSSAAALIGRSVLVPGSIARPDPAGEIRGQVELEKAATSVVVTYSDARTGAILHTDTIGARTAGPLDIAWTEVPESIQLNRSRVAVDVRATVDGASVNIQPEVYARIQSVTATGASSTPTFDVEDFGALSGLEITSFR